ncbi:hypothetical protein RB653_007872 [Dictyostelium firmibasis]|uniref:Enoyl-CoA hydratase/isomerase domain-containing protein n=1 Tax=Dictyostelium firmibasis TaxID=79012 RepID=A0AAN7TWD3_9MYCE
MIDFLLKKLKEYNNDKETKFVIICSSNQKSFSSGGDLKELTIHSKSPGGVNFFIKKIYYLDHLIHTFKKPILSFVKGIVMGSGVGLSIHCSHRIVSDNVRWAMPENKIGYFPDIGVSYFLSKLGSIGLYLGMVGPHIKSEDLIKLNIANCYIPSNQFEETLNDLCNNPMIEGKNEIDSILNKYKKELKIDKKSSHIEKYNDIIERCFNREYKSVSEIFNNLKNEILCNDDLNEKQWAINTLSNLESSCPTSVCISFENIHRSLDLNINEIFINDNRIGSRIGNRQDFSQGVQKALIDKFYKPIFSPSSIYDISQTFIDSFFLPLNDKKKELTFSTLISKY